jgi:exodeoxyribonuclease-5
MSNKIRIHQSWNQSRDSGSTASVRLRNHVLNRIQKPYIDIPDPTPGIALEGEQCAARDDINDWIIHPDPDDRVLTIGGFAGCGKTVLARHTQAYLQSLGIAHAVTSLTGKATTVLRKKGVTGAQTIHSCLYTVDEEEKRKTGQLRFIKNSWLDYETIIIDEGQSLSGQALKDFLSFPHARLILFGDHGQLKPVGEDHTGIMEKPRIRLEEPRRQALGSNILQFAHAIRKGLTVRYGRCPGVMIAPKRDFWKDITDPNCDQIVVGFNKTRHQVNREVRKSRGYFGDVPVAGEKVICLYNQKDIGLDNGQILLVERTGSIKDGLVELVLDDSGTKYTVMAIVEQFGKNKLDYSLTNKFYIHGYRGVVFLDFAYGISCHKAMGSEWERGKVLEEYHPDWELARYGYTGVTRFSDAVDYYK